MTRSILIGICLGLVVFFFGGPPVEATGMPESGARMVCLASGDVIQIEYDYGDLQVSADVPKVKVAAPMPKGPPAQTVEPPLFVRRAPIHALLCGALHHVQLAACHTRAAFARQPVLTVLLAVGHAMLFRRCR